MQKEWNILKSVTYPFFQVLSFPMRYAGLVEISRIFMLDIEIIPVPNS